jgi:hypothetical protein
MFYGKPNDITLAGECVYDFLFVPGEGGLVRLQQYRSNRGYRDRLQP